MSRGRMTRLHTKTEGESSCHGMTRPPERMGAPRESKPSDPPQRPESRRGKDLRGQGGGDENPPTTRPTRERPPNRGDGAARRSATGRQDTETGTEERVRGTGHPKAYPTGAAAAAAVRGSVTAGPALTEKERDGGAGHPTAQTIGAAPATLEGDTVRAGPGPAKENTHREEGGDQTPRRKDLRGQGGGDENPPTTRPTRERPPNRGDGAARRSATGRQDTETGTEERVRGTGHPKAYPTGAAAAAAVRGSVTAGPALTEKERDGGAGHPTAQTIGAAPATLEGDTVRAGPAPAKENTHREEGGDQTPRRAREETTPGRRGDRREGPLQTVTRA